MEQQLNYFIQYLEQVRKSSRNTVLSYRRDLEKFWLFLMRRRFPTLHL